MRSQRSQGTQCKDQEAQFGWVVDEDMKKGYGLNDYHAGPSTHQASPVDRAHSLHEALLLLIGVTGSSARLLEKQPCLDQVLHGRAHSSATGHFLYSDIYAFGPGPPGPHLPSLPLESSQPVSPHLCQRNHPHASKYTTSSESPGKTHRLSESVYALSLMNL